MRGLYCSRVSGNPYQEDMITEITEKVFQIDGYEVADRLLEGILFDVDFSNGINVFISTPQTKKYFESNFNSDKFYQLVKEYASSIIEDGDEVTIPKYLRDKYFINGINVSYIN